MKRQAASRAEGRTSAPAANSGADPGAVLLPYQKRWVSDPAPFKVAEKGRRTGLTWAEAADNVLTAASARSAGGQNTYYIAYNEDMTVEYIQACALWAKQLSRAASEVEAEFWGEDEADKHIKTYTIRFPDSGFRIVALSSRPANLRGRQGTIVIDEAAFHDDLPNLLKAALAMLIWGGRVRVISTHDGAENPFNDLVQEIRAGKRRGTVHFIPFGQAVQEGLYKRVCLRQGALWTADAEAAWVAEVYAFYGAGSEEELDCVPANSGGAWLSRALIERNMAADTPVLRLAKPDAFTHAPEILRRTEIADWLAEYLKPLLGKIPAGVRCYLGQDFARSADLSVWAILYQTPTLSLRCAGLIELRNLPFSSQEQIAFALADGLPHCAGVAMDARGNGQHLAELTQQRYGPGRVAAVMFSESWYRAHTPAFKAALEDATLTDIPRDEAVLDDLRAFRVQHGVARIPDTRTTDKSGGKRHGDAGIALLLAHFAAKTLDGGVIAPFIPVGADSDTLFPERGLW